MLKKRTKKQSKIKNPSKRKPKRKKTALVSKKKKKVTKKKSPKKIKKRKEKLVGRVTHYYGKIKVAVVKLRVPLSVGDKIKIKGGEKEFEQTVRSIEVNHKKIKRAAKGKAIGLKLAKKAREGYRVYKL